MDILNKLREELQVERWQVEAAVKLIDEGNTIPFISRYRKEATGDFADYFRRTASDRRSCCERWKTEHGDRTIGLHEHYSGASGRHEGGKYGGAQGSKDPVLAALSGRKLDGGSLNGSKGQNSDYRG